MYQSGDYTFLNLYEPHGEVFCDISHKIYIEKVDDRDNWVHYCQFYFKRAYKNHIFKFLLKLLPTDLNNLLASL